MLPNVRDQVYRRPRCRQATNHAWVNRSNAVRKIAFILIDAHDLLANNK
jgi:hypothetical protein